MLIVIDNYDSFTYNLVQYFGELGCAVEIFRNDQITVEKLKELNPSHIVISPGPGTPAESGISMDVIREFAGKVPILGVCLGHQCIGEVYGAKVVRAPYLMHGKISKVIYSDKEELFNGMNNPFSATRYHSLIIDNKSIEGTPLEVTAWTADNIVMAVRHKDFRNLIGVQFHPESVLSEDGKLLLSNFLKIRGAQQAPKMAYFTK